MLPSLLTNKKSRTKYFLLSLLVCGSLTPSYGTEEEFNLGKRTQRAGEGNDEEVNEETQAELVLSPLREGALKRQ